MLLTNDARLTSLAKQAPLYRSLRANRCELNISLRSIFSRASPPLSSTCFFNAATCLSKPRTISQFYDKRFFNFTSITKVYNKHLCSFQTKFIGSNFFFHRTGILTTLTSLLWFSFAWRKIDYILKNSCHRIAPPHLYIAIHTFFVLSQVCTAQFRNISHSYLATHQLQYQHNFIMNAWADAC